MKNIFFFGFLFSVNNIHAQSPFNYGQNKKVYFISDSLRRAFEIDSIVEIDQQPAKHTGGMEQYWDITIESFTDETIGYDWYIIKDSNFVFNYDSILTKAILINGDYYDISSGNFNGNQGGGQGSFANTTVDDRNDSFSLTETDISCHLCEQPPTEYAKNVFDNDGKLIYSVLIPLDDSVYSEDGNSLVPYTDYLDERYKNSGMTELQIDSIRRREGNRSIFVNDTIFYHYDQNGHYIGEGKQVYPYPVDPKIFFGYYRPLKKQKEFHQYYIGKISMEKYLKTKLGYTPELVLFEFSRYGAISFCYDSKNKKYYQRREILLEK